MTTERVTSTDTEDETQRVKLSGSAPAVNPAEWEFVVTDDPSFTDGLAVLGGYLCRVNHDKA